MAADHDTFASPYDDEPNGADDRPPAPEKAPDLNGTSDKGPTRDHRPPASRPHGGFDAQEPRPQGEWALWTGIGAGIVWAAGAAAFLFGFYGGGAGVELPFHQTAGLLFVALGPLVAFGIMGVLARELIRFASTARRLERSARRLAVPTAAVGREARTLSDTMIAEIDRLNRSAEGALARLMAMEDVLQAHANSLSDAAGGVQGEVDAMVERLRNESAMVTGVSDTLAEHAAKITETLAEQAESVSHAVQTATRNAESGKALLDSGAERLVEAGASAQKASEKSALAVGEQLRDMEALVKVLDDRADQLDAVAKAHEDNLKVAQRTASELALAADAGVGEMRGAAETALEQARKLMDVIHEEVRRAASAGEDEIERVRSAVKEARSAAGDAFDGLGDGATAQIEGRVNSVERTLDAIDKRLADLPRAAELRARELHDAFEGELRELRASGAARAAQDPNAPSEFRNEPPLRDPREEHAARANGRPRRGSGGLPDEFASPHREEDEPRPLPRDPRLRAARRAPNGDNGFDEDGYDDGFVEEPGGRSMRRETFRDDRREDPRERHRGEDRALPREPDDDGMTLRDARPGAVGRPPRDRRGGRDRDRDAGLERAPSRRARERDRLPPNEEERGFEPPADTGAPEGRDMAPGADEPNGWRWKDLLKTMDDGPDSDHPGSGVVVGLRRAGVDPSLALDPDMTARVARARRRAGAGEARALLLDSASTDVRRTQAALAADPKLRQRAEVFLEEHGRAVRRAVDQNDTGALSSLLDSDAGRAFLLVDAALADG